MSIVIQTLEKNYGNQKALKGVSCQIPQGQIVGLLGPNGAGKSTLMKCITGTTLDFSGELKVMDAEVQKKPLQVKKHIGFLPENNPLYTDMYVREYLTFIADIRKVPTANIQETIEKVGLQQESKKKIKELSKGYKQRVGLAQAILHNPPILILDEPTNGLDPNQIMEIRALIQNLGKDKTVILSTHIMQEVEALCQRVILLHQGNLIADQSIEEFKGNYASLEEAFQQNTQL